MTLYFLPFRRDTAIAGEGLLFIYSNMLRDMPARRTDIALATEGQ